MVRFAGLKGQVEEIFASLGASLLNKLMDVEMPLSKSPRARQLDLTLKRKDYKAEISQLQKENKELRATIQSLNENLKSVIGTNSETDEKYQKYKRIIYEKTLEISKLR
jgi:peptidoglycan hydrolase CwlO-like protein